MFKFRRAVALALVALVAAAPQAAKPAAAEPADQSALLAQAACAAVNADVPATSVAGWWIVPGSVAHIVLETAGQAPRHCLATGEGRVLTNLEADEGADTDEVDRAFVAALGCLAEIPDDQQPATADRIGTDGNGTYAVRIDVRGHDSWACIAHDDGSVISLIPRWQINI